MSTQKLTARHFDRFQRSRRTFAICVAVIGGLIAAAAVAGMIYVYYQTARFHASHALEDHQSTQHALSGKVCISWNRVTPDFFCHVV